MKIILDVMTKLICVCRLSHDHLLLTENRMTEKQPAITVIFAQRGGIV